MIDFTFISIGARQDRPASGTKCADGESVVEPIDYFMAIFTGMCIGLAGMAYFWSGYRVGATKAEHAPHRYR